MVIMNNGNALELICSRGEILMLQASLSEFPELRENIYFTETSAYINNPDVKKELLAELLRHAGIKTYL